jgi:hypoxanthine phosphoribosyltransferase
VNVNQEEPVRDEYSAVGGMPLIPKSLPLSDRSTPKATASEVSWMEFDRRIRALAQVIGRTYRPTAVMGIAHGGVFVGGALASALGAEFYPVRLTHRNRDRAPRTDDGIRNEVPEQLRGAKVLVVDDIASSGDTFELAINLARARGAKQLRTASLVARPGSYAPDFVSETTTSLLVFPWDYASVSEDARFDPE